MASCALTVTVAIIVTMTVTWEVHDILCHQLLNPTYYCVHHQLSGAQVLTLSLP